MSSSDDANGDEQLEPYELLTSTRYDPFLRSQRWNYDRDGSSSFFLLPYHYARLEEAIRLHRWQIASFSYHRLKSECKAAVAAAIAASADEGVDPATAMKYRRSSATPTLAAYFQPTDDPALLEPALRLCVDSEPTRKSLFTTTKTTKRAGYEAARERAGIRPGELADVLLYNEDGALTEASISNVAFFRDSYWVTPPLSTGCLPGVLRAWLLKQGRIRRGHPRHCEG
ncbi:aminotransferase class IV-domain-containing protein [Schizophyllum amplum]|uniref:Aminotransferase class IV-domain-containing protein n=1 Tax=Schizophyllum amplum TaxID=97359 RepID=A0A550CND4_9AGAR|nr:aminotransferase class IV-domain-containing protein [Auriculariopsis ampla]